MTIFGTFLLKQKVERTVLEHLQLWMDTYLAEVERQNALTPGSIARPKFWTVTPGDSIDLLGEQKLPAVAVLSPGIAGKPVKEGDGTYRASWTVGVGAVVSARSQDGTADLAGYYGAAIRGIMLQKVPQGLPWEGISWDDEGYDDLPSDGNRSLAISRDIFTIDFRNVVNTRSGPIDPDPVANPQAPDAYPDWPTIPDAAHVITTVKRSH